MVCAAGISRFASFHDGLWRGWFDDPAFEQIAKRDMTDGQHRNIAGEHQYFTTAFFHHPDELRAEVSDAGLTCEDVLAIEGTVWMLPDFDKQWEDPVKRKRLLDFLRATEAERSLLGATGHMLAVGRRA